MSGITTVGIIGGHGWMGQSLRIALFEKGILTPDRLMISSRAGGDNYTAWPAVRDTRDNQ